MEKSAARKRSALFCVWRTGRVPAEWNDGIVVSLCKGKGIKSVCSSYKSISLLSVPGKVFAHVLLDWLQPLLERTKQPHQSGFTCGRSIIDAILALRLLSEIHREFSRPLHVAYVDIKAAFDSVDCMALWKALKGRGVPHLVLQLLWRTFTPKKMQRCIQVGSYQGVSIRRRAYTRGAYWRPPYSALP